MKLQLPKLLNRTILLLCLLLILAITACTTEPVTTVYKAEATTDLAVTAAMTGWGAYVALKHLPVAEEVKVHDLFGQVILGELAVLDATVAVQNNPTNTAPVVAAQNALDASRLDLVNLISSLTNAPTH